MDIELYKPLKISKLNSFMTIINKHSKKTVKISVGSKFYGVKTFRDKEDADILELRGFKEGYLVPDYEKDNFTIHVDYGKELLLNKFRKIIKNLVSNKNNVLKVSIKGELYDIVEIKDRNDVLILVIDFKNEVEANWNPSQFLFFIFSKFH